MLLLQIASFPSPPPASRMHGTSSPFSASCLKDAWNLLAPRRPHLKDAWKVFPSPCIASRMRGPSLPRATLYFKDAWDLLTLGHFSNPGCVGLPFLSPPPASRMCGTSFPFAASNPEFAWGWCSLLKHVSSVCLGVFGFCKDMKSQYVPGDESGATSGR